MQESVQETFSNRRRIERKSLYYYLKVIELETGKELGRIVDITSEGMMLFGYNILDKEKIYHARIILEESVFDMTLGNLDIDVQIRWSRPDANPQLVLTGMLFLNLNERGKKIVRSLINKIGINRPLDLTEEDIESGLWEEYEEI
jgi:hypothetical protein